jgi:hypothetical protein
MIADPNISSPANVDASVEFRQDHDAFAKHIKSLIEKANSELPEGFEMPKARKKNPEIKFEMDDDIGEYEIEQHDDEEIAEEEPHEDEESENISELEEIIKMEQVKINLLEANKGKKKNKMRLSLEDTAEDHSDDEHPKESHEEPQETEKIAPITPTVQVHEVPKEVPKEVTPPITIAVKPEPLKVEDKPVVQLYVETKVEAKKPEEQLIKEAPPPELKQALAKNPPPKNQCCLVM